MASPMIVGINEEKFLTQEDDYKGGFDYSETFYCPYLNFCTEKAPSKQPGLVDSTALLRMIQASLNRGSRLGAKTSVQGKP